MDAYEIVFVDRSGIKHTFPLSWASTILYPDRCVADIQAYQNHPVSLHVSLYHLYAGKCEMFSGGPMSLYVGSHIAHDKYEAPYAFGGKGKCQDRPVSQLLYAEQDRQTIRTIEFDFGNKKKISYGCSFKTDLEMYYHGTLLGPTVIDICPDHFKIPLPGEVFIHCCANKSMREIRTIASYGDFASVEVL